MSAFGPCGAESPARVEGADLVQCQLFQSELQRAVTQNPTPDTGIRLGFSRYLGSCGQRDGTLTAQKGGGNV